MNRLCNIDGRIKPENDATIPVLDRGFLFGDSVCEVVRTHRGRLLQLDAHIARLKASAARVLIDVPITDEKLQQRIEETVELAGNDETYVRLIVTRGVSSAPVIDPDYTLSAPSVIVIVRPMLERPQTVMSCGSSAWLVDVRRNHPDALDPAIKSGNYLNNILALNEARKHNADVALLLNSAGCLTEAATANVFLVQEGKLRTPSLAAGIVAGITRRVVAQRAQAEGYTVEEADLTAEDARSADEIFLTCTTQSIAPITRLDGELVGSGRPGLVTLRIAERYEAWCDELVGWAGAPALN